MPFDLAYGAAGLFYNQRSAHADAAFSSYAIHFGQLHHILSPTASMNLFSAKQDEPHNLLPADGFVQYYGPVVPWAEANDYLQALLDTINWENDVAIIHGQRIVTARKIAWHADKPFAYSYSNTTKIARPWTSELLELKNLVEKHTGERFNACLLNLYHNGSEGMSWHSDAETQLKRNGAIASLSFGAERNFSLRHKSSKQKASVVLQHGSLLVMKGKTQSFWQHRLPPATMVRGPRVNLTFRMMVDGLR